MDRKERGFASNYFVFLKFDFIKRTCYKLLISCANSPNVDVHTLSVGGLFEDAFFL